jgi:hypothetical protein
VSQAAGAETSGRAPKDAEHRSLNAMNLAGVKTRGRPSATSAIVSNPVEPMAARLPTLHRRSRRLST